MALTPAERAKRYRDKLKLNAEKYEEQRKKQIARVKKAQKKIRELSEREKAETRKIWREQKKKQREAKKQAEREELAATPPKATSRHVDYKKKYINLIKNYNSAIKQLNKARKTNQRLRKTLSRTKKTQEKKNVEKEQEINKLKARHEVLEIALTQKYKNCETNEQKKVLRSIGKSNNTALSKKGVKKIISEGLGLKSSIRFSQTKRFLSKNIKEMLEAFYSRDEISRATAGKRETRTKQKKKMQIRYLTDTLHNLYQVYKEEGGIYSFSTFCKYRPFYVLSPTNACRDTCLCVKHSNFDFVVSAIKKHTISELQNKSGKDLLKLVSCDINSQSCMYNDCDICRNKTINFTADKNTVVEWCQWERSKKSYKKNDKDMTANITKKEIKVGTIQELIDEFEKQLPLYKKHFYNIQEQQRQYRMCIENLKPNECAILVDFSENYDCKLAQEIQSLHFGGSKNSITLHTGMIFLETQCQSFVSLSDSNCHEPHAIWAHLIPIIKLAKKMCPNLSVIHFFSDGPSSQYRQKKNFFLLNLFTEKLKLSMITWSFSESGHGKGVADGIGGATKRALDRRVCYGHDISNATDAFNNLKMCNTATKPFLIPNSDIENIKKLIPNNLKAVAGTMQIHQIISTTKNEILHRQLSCFCERGQCICLSPTRHYFFKDLGSDSKVEVCDSSQTEKVKFTKDTTPNTTYLNLEANCDNCDMAPDTLKSYTDSLCHNPDLPSIIFTDITKNTNQNNTTYLTEETMNITVASDTLNKPEMQPNITKYYTDSLCHDPELPNIIFADSTENTNHNNTYLTEETIDTTVAPRKFDQTLLNNVKASREDESLLSGRNYKLQVTAGKSVSEEKVLAPKKTVRKKETQVKRSDKLTNVTLLSDLKCNKENSITENIIDVSPKSKTQNSNKSIKVTVLSDVKFTKQNAPFYGLKNMGTLNLLQIDKNCDISSARNRSEPPKQVKTNINVYGTLSSSEEEIEETFSNKTNKRKRPRLCLKQSIKKKKPSDPIIVDPITNYNYYCEAQTLQHADKIEEQLREASAEKEISQQVNEEDIHTDKIEEQLQKASAEKEISQEVNEGDIHTDKTEEQLQEASAEKEISQHLNEEDIHTDKTEEQLQEAIAEKEISQQFNEVDIHTDKLKEQLQEASTEKEISQQLNEGDIHTDKIEEQLQETSVKKEISQQFNEGDIHTDKAEEQLQETSAEKEISQLNVGDVVLTRYYVRKTWRYYIGVIEDKDFTTRRYLIAYYKTIGKENSKKFVKPKRTVDKDNVPENCIVKVVQLLQINECPEEYVLMHHEDNIYFS